MVSLILSLNILFNVITLCIRTLKINISVKNRGVLKQRVSEKHVFVHLKIIISMKNRGVSEYKGCPNTKGVRKHRMSENIG